MRNKNTALIAPLPTPAEARYVRRSLVAFDGHSAPGHCVRYSPDGRLVVSGGADGTLKLWDARNMLCLATWARHEAGIVECAFSPDSTLVVSASTDRTLKLWDVRKGRCLGTWTGHTDVVTAVAFSRDGRFVVSGSYDKTVRLWDPSTGSCRGVWVGHDGNVHACAFSPDGTRVVSGSSDSTLKLWSVATGQRLQTWGAPNSSTDLADGEIRDGWGDKEERCIFGCAFSPDGTRVVSANGAALKIWDTETGKCLTSWKASARECAFSSDGTRIVSVTFKMQIHVWDARTFQCVTCELGTYAESGALSPDGSRLVSAAIDGSISLWDVEKSKVLAGATAECLVTRPGRLSQDNACVFSPDGTQIASILGGKFIVWDSATGRLLTNNLTDCEAMSVYAYSPDGSRAVGVTAGPLVRVWDTTSGKRLASCSFGHTSRVDACVFSPDGARFVSSDWNGELRVWNAKNGECLVTIAGDSAGLGALRFSEDGSLIITVDYDRAISVWDSHSGSRVKSWPGDAVDKPLALTARIQTGALSPDGTRLIASRSREAGLSLWDTMTGQCLATWTGVSSAVHCCAFSHDGMHVVTASDDGALELWHVTSGQCIGIWWGHQHRVHDCAFSPDNKQVISIGPDGMLVWDVASGTLVRRHQFAQESHAVWKPGTNEIIEASDGAWRWLKWQILDDQGNIIEVLDAEAFGELPSY